jgi:acyl carrier protein
MIGNGRTDEAQIQAFLRSKVARLVRLEEWQVSPAASFEELGLDSMAAVSLTAELSDVLGIPIEPTLTWDCPTIEEAARAVYREWVQAREAR